MFIYLNKEIVKLEDARISPLDHGFLYGVGLFETFRIYDGHPFLLDDHLVRLNEGLAELKIRYKLAREDVLKIVKDVLEANGLKDAYVRLNVSAGNGEIGLRTEEYYEPNTIVFMKPIPHLLKEKEGLIVTTVRNTPEGTTRLKSHHYLNSIYAKREVGEKPQIEGLLLSKEGYLTEGVTSNLFWVKKGVIHTPSLETGILNGITRQFICSIASKLGISVQEGFYYVNDLESCEEAFITNSIQEIIPLNKVNSVPLPGSNGEITRELQLIYKQERNRLWSRIQLGGRLE